MGPRLQQEAGGGATRKKLTLWCHSAKVNHQTPCRFESMNLTAQCP